MQVSLSEIFKEKPLELVSILTLANAAGSGNNKQDKAFFEVLSFLITKQFPHLPISELEKAIENGILGKYNSEGYIPITSATIYRWVCAQNDEYIKAQNKKVESLPNYHELLYSDQIVKTEAGFYVVKS